MQREETMWRDFGIKRYYNYENRLLLRTEAKRIIGMQTSDKNTISKIILSK